MESAEANNGHWIVREEEVPEYYRISSSDLHDETVIGFGSASVVYKAKWLCCEVAVKDVLLRRDIGRCFPKELEILMRLPHPHVVQLLGFRMKEEERRVSIVMEHMETSLRSVVSRRLRESRRRRPFDVREAIDIVTKIALGMKFLHSREIVHGGLSTAIILMNVHGDKDFEVKIAGFAFSDYANSPIMSVPGPHPPEFIAAEEIHSPITVTKAVDVYSFGMLCYAALTGCEEGLPPWNDYNTRYEIVQAAVSGLRPELIPADIDHGLMQLVLKCCKAEPEDRPSFPVICNTLDGIRAAREQGLQKQTRLVTEESDAQRWTTYKDDNDDVCLEIATILETLPNHLSINAVDVEWRRPIGTGGYSEVYEVNWLGCLFAVKRFRSVSADLKGEVDVLTKLQHPHIARLMGLSIDSNGGWIMMERMETDLEKLIHSRASKPPFSHSEARELCFKIALGLNYLHSKNVVHRDIKPANVLVHDYLFQSLKFRGRFDVKITDFGVSHRIGNSNVATVAGTGSYRAPEILKIVEEKSNEPLTEDELKKTDIYSFGMTCYEIVTGNVLHELMSRKDVLAKRRPKLPHDLHADLRVLISKCWDDDPEARPDFSTICDLLASDGESRNRVVQSSRVGKIVEFWRRKSLLPFSQCLGRESS